MMTCSAPPDCEEIERRHATGVGLLIDGGASRGNLLSGEADEVILTVSRMQAEKKANPGYRAFFANGFNVTRVLVLYFWEVFLEIVRVVAGGAPRRAPARAPRRDLPVPARGDVRGRPGRDRLRRPHRHDGAAGPRSTRRSRATTRSLTTPGSSAPTRWRRSASSTSSSAGSTAPAATRRGRTSSSCSPTTARRRAPRSSSGTATGSTSSSAARSSPPRSRRCGAATRTTRWRARRSARPPARRRRSGRRTTSATRT